MLNEFEIEIEVPGLKEIDEIEIPEKPIMMETPMRVVKKKPLLNIKTGSE